MEAEQEDDILFNELINESLAYQSRYHQTDILDTEDNSPAWRPKDRVSFFTYLLLKFCIMKAYSLCRTHKNFMLTYIYDLENTFFVVLIKLNINFCCSSKLMSEFNCIF